MFLRGRRSTADAAGSSALDELLSTEREIALQTTAAGSEAAALTTAARDDAARIAKESREALALELSALGERDREAREQLIHTIERDGARLVLRYESIGAAEIASLAAFAVSEVMGTGTGNPR